MRTLLILALLTSLHTSAQTNIISLKSHQGNMEDLHLETDNFGLPSPILDSIIYIGGTCIVEVTSQLSASLYYDTVCDHRLFLEHDFDLKEIKKHYPSRVKFIGFENYPKMKDKNTKASKHKTKQNYLSGILVMLLLAGVFSPIVLKK